MLKVYLDYKSKQSRTEHMIKEDNPLSFSGLELNLTGNRRETEESRRAIFSRASEEDLARLTDIQLHVLNLIFFPEGKGLTLKRIGKELGGVTREAVRQARNAGINRLARLQRGEPAIRSKKIEMDPEIEAKLLQNPHLSREELSDLVGHSIAVVNRFRDELNIPRNPGGRPRKPLVA